MTDKKEYDPEKKTLRKKKDKKDMRGGAVHVTLELRIGAKYQQNKWNCMLSNVPWDFLEKGAWGGDEWMAKKNDVKFRTLLNEARMDFKRTKGGQYELSFFFTSVETDTDYMEFKVHVNPHFFIEEHKTFSQAEYKRALQVAKTHLVQFQKTAALKPPGKVFIWADLRREHK